MGWLERQDPRVATYVPSTGYARAQATTGAGNEEESYCSPQRTIDS